MNDILAPERESEVEHIVRSACANGAKLDIVGGGAHAGLGRPRAGERRLSIAGLTGHRLLRAGGNDALRQGRHDDR